MSEVLVIMPYGCRSYFSNETIVKADFDQIYAELIRPAIDAAGHKPLRVDEMVVGGDITHQYIEKIFASEIVIADLSMPNGNVYYELGIRQSLSNQPTILIARHGTDLPFDVRNQRILFYHFGDAGPENSFSAKLSSQLQNIRPGDYRNPIQAYLKIAGLSTDPSNGEAFEKDLRGKTERASNAEQVVAVWNWVRGLKQLPPYPLMDLAEKCSVYKLWYLAAEITRVASHTKPQDYEIHRRLGWYLRNAGEGHYDEAEAAFRKALELNPGDPEAIGMLGGLLKRKGQYGAAAEIYSRGVVIAPDNLYLRVAHAGTKLLSSAANPNDAITLYSAIKSQYENVGVVPDEWIHSALGETEFVLGNMEGARQHFKKAREMASSATSLVSPADQIELFGRAGFRSKESIQLAQYVRQLANSFGSPSDVQVELIEKDGRSAAGKPPVILHLSDVHFGSAPDANGKMRSMHRFEDSDHSITLSEHLYNEFCKPKSRFQFDADQLYIVVSGDIVYTASQEEYRLAQAFVKTVSERLNVPKEKIIFCPGNHDVFWTDDRTQRFDHYLEFLRKFYGDELFKFRYPLVKWDFRIGTERPQPADIVSAVKFDEHSILFASFNSCVYETKQQHYGFVGEKQLGQMRDLLDEHMDGSLLKIAVFHHHIHPYPEPIKLNEKEEHWTDLSTLRDGGLLEKFLEKQNFDVVLHGHKHKAQLRETLVRDENPTESLRPLFVCGAGSCGVATAELEHAVANQYQVLEFLSHKRNRDLEFLRVEWRELAARAGAEWITPKEWTLLG